MYSSCFKLYRAYSISFSSSNVGNFFWSWILKDCIKVRKKKKKVVALCSRSPQKRDARAELLICQSKPFAFLLFSLTSPSSLFKPVFHQRTSISTSTSTCVSKWRLGRHNDKHKKNGQVRSCACGYAYVVALTSENWVDISTSISTRPWTNHRSLWPRPHAKHIESNMADASTTILFIIGLRRAAIENWVKYAILRVRMSLCLCLCASENQALSSLLLRLREVVAWENSRHYATPSLVSSRNDVGETSAEIPQWWRVISQIFRLVVEKLVSANQKDYPDLGGDTSWVWIPAVVSQTSFPGKPVVASCNVGCFLRQEWWSMSGSVIDAQTTDNARKTISFKLRSYLGLPYLLFVLLIKVFSSFCLTYDVRDSASSSSTQWTYALL